MRGWLAWLIAIAAGIAIVLVVTAVIGTRDDEGETVTAGAWAQSTCGAIGVWRGEVEAILQGVRTSRTEGTESAAPTPEGRLGAVRGALERTVRATDTLVTALDNSGTPDTPEGEEAAELVSDWADEALDDLEDAQDALDEEPETLEEGVEELAEATKALASVLRSGVETLSDVARLDPELAAALSAASTCQQLQDERR